MRSDDEAVALVAAHAFVILLPKPKVLGPSRAREDGFLVGFGE